MIKKLDRFRNKENKIWLNVASSTEVLDGFINIENHPFIRIAPLFPIVKFIIPSKYHERLKKFNEAMKSAIFIKHNCRKPLPFPSDSVDHILSSHFLEHVFPSEAEKIIKDFHRVLKKGGTIHIIVPDIEFIVKEYLEAKDNGIQDAADKFIKRTILSRETRGSFKYRIVEFLGNLGLQHHWMYDKSSMILRLKKLDFKILEYYSSPSSNYRVGDNSVHLLVRKE